MKTITIIIAALALHAGLLCSAVLGTGIGRLCLAPIPVPKWRPEPVDKPKGTDSSIEYSVQIDGAEWIELSSKEAKCVKDMNMNENHLVAIRADGKQIESFRFTFEADHADLCLFQSPLYFTWILRPAEETGDWCPCYSSEE